ncbi:MAG: hypothetical protein F6K37_41075, partial [Moorea sp. SIO4E2]|uniref:AAA-like domain-containing protein n=1 Tax=Moorena sp. SIO4E2 TaxID=2607826 RepID=UPI0013BDC731
MAAYNYYQVGGSLRYKHPTYIERQADKDLYEGLKNGDFCYVLNSRQMGKSSLRVRMMKILKEEGVKCASIDMGRLGSLVTPENWYGGVVSELWRGFSLSTDIDGDRIWWQQQGWLPPVLRLSRFIEDVLLAQFSKNIVIFIDEIDNIIKINFKDDFFTFIRTCYNQRVDNPEYARLTFCLLGVATPSNLIQDKKRTPFNVGRAIELTGFTLKEARLPLTRGLKETVDNPDKVLGKVLHSTGGQPFLTQKLCQLIVQNAESKSLNIEQLIQKYVIDNWEVQDEPEHLRTIRDRLLSNELRAVKLLELYKQILRFGGSSTNNNTDEVELRLSGLVVKQNGQLKVYNPIYQQVFNLDWVENQLVSLWLLFQHPGSAKDIPVPSPNLPDLTKFFWFCVILLA